jgi:hypothetical protein
MVASKKPKQSDIEIVNQKLKAAGVRLRVVVLNYKLYLCGTLPPRPVSTERQSKQTYDDIEHQQQRRLLVPPFHGEHLSKYGQITPDPKAQR